MIKKLALNLYFFLFALFTFSEKSLSLTKYEINKFCEKEKRKSICIKNLHEKRSNLKKGQFIEIPVLPYEK